MYCYFQRGSLTGVRNKHADRKGEVPLWRRSHRYRLVRFANDMSSNAVSLLAVDARGQALFFKTCRWTLARWVDVKLAASRAWVSLLCLLQSPNSSTNVKLDRLPYLALVQL
jgi:hypothetical protein